MYDFFFNTKEIVQKCLLDAVNINLIAVDSEDITFLPGPSIVIKYNRSFLGTNFFWCLKGPPFIP